MPVALKRRQHLRVIANQRQIGYSKYGYHAASKGEGDSCDGEGSATDCNVSDNESDVLEIEEVESESDNDLSSHRKRV